ncbi:DUF1684 domain-containing protein [Halorientalis pallida]|uniref:DUF1684 domain-containing protein n=1 Tax=Halorientalis pallida TaxID=2479928 RepID=A0A498KZF8_9EURY|nr:DUF1684 domain-containing protein [Halorientalis pallida]RXK51116.1 DUF1684 domain-containing protein [Halorientalis pallida]
MTDDTDDWVERLRANREEKDRFFAEHRQSPIPPAERDGFDGLEYYPPDPDYRVTATVTVHDEPEPVEMDTTEGRTVRYLRIVTFAFDLDGETYTLHGYRQEHEDGGIFVPIRDKTTGQSSYEHGRYMELEPDRALTDGDEVTLDFNLAYSPFCAFSETFDCPLPPEENWLETTVEAGERAP